MPLFLPLLSALLSLLPSPLANPHSPLQAPVLEKALIHAASSLWKEEGHGLQSFTRVPLAMASRHVGERLSWRQGAQRRESVDKESLGCQGQKSNTNSLRNGECGVCEIRQKTAHLGPKKRGMPLSHRDPVPPPGVSASTSHFRVSLYTWALPSLMAHWQLLTLVPCNVSPQRGDNCCIENVIGVPSWRPWSWPMWRR